LLPYIRPEMPINSVESVLNKSYFIPWLVGFIEAESCFALYKPVSSLSYVASFEISQTDGYIIILGIREFLKLTPKVITNKTNNSRLKVSSVRGVKNVIKFMHKAPIQLLEYKRLQYIIWLKKLRTIPRYGHKINIPLNY